MFYWYRKQTSKHDLLFFTNFITFMFEVFFIFQMSRHDEMFAQIHLMWELFAYISILSSNQWNWRFDEQISAPTTDLLQEAVIV